MKPRIVGFLLATALFFITDHVSARPTEGKSSNSSQWTETERKTAQYGRRPKQAKLGLRDTSDNPQKEVQRRSRVTKHSGKLQVLSPLKKVYNENKRQFIMRPSHQFSHPLMFMRPPPMTQRTIVTTRIPRPPLAIPYNPYFPRSYFGMHRMHRPYPYYDPSMARYYGDDEEEEEGKLYNVCSNF